MKAQFALLLAGFLLAAQVLTPLSPALASPQLQDPGVHRLFLPLLFGAGSAGQPTVQPSPAVTQTPTATGQPTAEPTAGATVQPTTTATAQPTAEPTQGVTPQPTATVQPTAQPTPEPTAPANTADLAIAQVANTHAILPNLAFSLVLSVTNHGPAAAEDVRVTAALPADLAYLYTAPAGAYDAGTGVWQVGDLAAGQQARLSIQVRAAKTGTFTLTARVSGGTPDPNPANNSAAASVRVTTSGGVFQSDSFDSPASSLDRWRFIPGSRSRSHPDIRLSVADGNAVITIPGGSEHDIYTSDANGAPRLVQSVDDAQTQRFVLQATFASDLTGVPTGYSKRQGILVERNRSDYFSFDLSTNGNSLVLRAMRTSPNAYGPSFVAEQVHLSGASQAPRVVLQVTRAGDLWRFEYSTDGGKTFRLYGEVTANDGDQSTPTPVDDPMRVTVMGVFAANYQAGDGTNAPQFTCRVQNVTVSLP